jgi:hypothetical protein
MSGPRHETLDSPHLPTCASWSPRWWQARAPGRSTSVNRLLNGGLGSGEKARRSRALQIDRLRGATWAPREGPSRVRFFGAEVELLRPGFAGPPEIVGPRRACTKSYMSSKRAFSALAFLPLHKL